MLAIHTRVGKIDEPTYLPAPQAVYMLGQTFQNPPL